MQCKHATVAALCVLAASAMPTALGQQAPAPEAPAVRQATFDRATAAERQRVRFDRRAARLGDAMQQTVRLDVRLAMSHRRGNELVERKQSRVEATQRRVVTATEVDEGRTTAVRVQYLDATRQLEADGVPGEVAAQPVQGKTYHCRRAAGPESELVVTDAEGRTPPPEELEIVVQQMDMVGRPNPLAQLLGGRTVAIGETVELPKEIAAQLFNLGDRYGEVARFDLTLQKLETREGVACAVFSARVEAASNDSSQMRMQVEGPLVIEVATCRPVQLSLAGPIGMSETRGSYSTVYQLLGTGQLTTRIETVYRDAGA